MLFVIDDAIADSIRANNCSVKCAEALELLGLAMFEGKHRITASQASLMEFSRYGVLSRKASAAYREAQNDFQADQSLVKTLDVHIFLTDTVAHIGATFSGKTRRINIPTYWIDDSAKVQATCLIGEFLTDCQFLQRVGAVARASNGIINCLLNFEHTNGGGSTVAKVVAEKVATNRLCCSVVDSDKSCEAGPFGDTAKAARAFNDPAVYPLVGITETIGRELENMVQLNFINRKYSSDPNHANGVKILKHAESADFALRLYYDLKKGLTLADVLKLKHGSPQKKFWDPKLVLLGTHLKQSHAQFPCAQQSKCSTKTCECRVSNGFGTKVLDAFLQDFDELGEKHILSEITPPLIEEWKRIGHFLLSWGCARDRIRA